MVWRPCGHSGIRDNKTPTYEATSEPRYATPQSFRHADNSTSAVPHLRPSAGTPPHTADQRIAGMPRMGQKINKGQWIPCISYRSYAYYRLFQGHQSLFGQDRLL